MLFEAVVLRVPMDSMSGAHRLNFKGFTGIKNYRKLLVYQDSYSKLQKVLNEIEQTII